MGIPCFFPSLCHSTGLGRTLIGDERKSKRVAVWNEGKIQLLKPLLEECSVGNTLI